MSAYLLIDSFLFHIENALLATVSSSCTFRIWLRARVAPRHRDDAQKETDND